MLCWTTAEGKWLKNKSKRRERKRESKISPPFFPVTGRVQVLGGGCQCPPYVRKESNFGVADAPLKLSRTSVKDTSLRRSWMWMACTFKMSKGPLISGVIWSGLTFNSFSEGYHRISHCSRISWRQTTLCKLSVNWFKPEVGMATRPSAFWGVHPFSPVCHPMSQRPECMLILHSQKCTRTLIPYDFLLSRFILSTLVRDSTHTQSWTPKGASCISLVILPVLSYYRVSP